MFTIIRKLLFIGVVLFLLSAATIGQGLLVLLAAVLLWPVAFPNASTDNVCHESGSAFAEDDLFEGRSLFEEVFPDDDDKYYTCPSFSCIPGNVCHNTYLDQD